jgi:hypothetical protein
MTAKKTPTTTASKSTELTDATKTTVLTNNSNNSMQSNNPINSTNAVNSDNAVNRTTTVNPDNLFGSDQNATEVMAQPKQQRIGKQQRKSDFADFKAAYLSPAKLEKRHPVNIEDSVWAKPERIARILGDRDTSVGRYINAILSEHLELYADDIEVWRKL